MHFALEALQVVLADSSPSTLLLWMPHAVYLQQALQRSSASHVELAAGNSESEKDSLSGCLLSWVEAAFVYQKRGVAGLLKYTAGVVNQLTATGLSPGETTEFDRARVNDQANVDAPSIPPVRHVKGVGQGRTVTKLASGILIQLTAAFRILAHVSSHAVSGGILVLVAQ